MYKHSEKDILECYIEISDSFTVDDRIKNHVYNVFLNNYHRNIPHIYDSTRSNPLFRNNYCKYYIYLTQIPPKINNIIKIIPITK